MDRRAGGTLGHYVTLGTQMEAALFRRILPGLQRRSSMATVRRKSSRLFCTIEGAQRPAGHKFRLRGPSLQQYRR